MLPYFEPLSLRISSYDTKFVETLQEVIRGSLPRLEELAPKLRDEGPE